MVKQVQYSFFFEAYWLFKKMEKGERGQDLKQILPEASVGATNLSSGLSRSALWVSKEHPQNNKDV